MKGSADRYSMKGSADRYSMKGSAERYSMKCSADRYSMKCSADRYSMKGSAERYSMKGSAGRYSMKGSADRYSMKDSADRYSMKSSADRQSPWQIPIVVRMSLPVLLPIFTFNITSFMSRYIICSSPGVKMLSRICMSFGRFIVSNAFDMSSIRMEMSYFSDVITF